MNESKSQPITSEAILGACELVRAGHRNPSMKPARLLAYASALGVLLVVERFCRLILAHWDWTDPDRVATLEMAAAVVEAIESLK